MCRMAGRIDGAPSQRAEGPAPAGARGLLAPWVQLERRTEEEEASEVTGILKELRRVEMRRRERDRRWRPALCRT